EREPHAASKPHRLSINKIAQRIPIPATGPDVRTGNTARDFPAAPVGSTCPGWRMRFTPNRRSCRRSPGRRTGQCSQQYDTRDSRGGPTMAYVHGAHPRGNLRPLCSVSQGHFGTRPVSSWPRRPRGRWLTLAPPGAAGDVRAAASAWRAHRIQRRYDPMSHESILDTIGNTPVVKLQRLAPKHVELHVKVESFNPGGSVKDRLALAVVLDAERSGALKPGQTIIEATSGNTGVALAMVAAARGYPFVAVMADSFS